MQISEQKQSLRQEFLQKRESLSLEQVHDLSSQIQEEVLKTERWQKAESIGLYSPVRQEVDCQLLFMSALEEGKMVYFPRVEQGLGFYEVRDPSDLQKGAWSILEPKHECAELKEGEVLDLLIVPGIVFDKQGYRIGYGKGFYDNFLSQTISPTLSLAYDFQVIDNLPHEPFDVCVSQIITDKTTYPL